MKLQNWTIAQADNLPYDAPEIKLYYAVGNVYGHPQRTEGSLVRTNRIVEINLEKRYIKTASGSKYHLGKMNPEYAKWLHKWRKEQKEIK